MYFTALLIIALIGFAKVGFGGGLVFSDALTFDIHPTKAEQASFITLIGFLGLIW